MFKNRSLVLFKKKKDSSKVAKVIPSAPEEVRSPWKPSPQSHPLFEPVMAGQNFRYICYKVDMKLNITSREPAKNIVDIYLMGQQIQDDYNGPQRSKKLYLSLFVAGLHSLERRNNHAQVACYECCFNGPLVFPYVRATPIDWSPSGMSTSYSCNVKGRTDVVYNASIYETNMKGPSFRDFCNGNPDLNKPSSDIVLSNFGVPTVRDDTGEWFIDMNDS
ncbi:matrix protein [Harbour porpoise rhabdovirus]|uniref:Matrix protein n=1 Tax=Harbour porpoise rhabdovirus TaxID=2598784 RepID=A0AAE6M2U9_9RHAB|nr:matrix protein [Harbour porpoise rhabdovirus]QDZ59979.1 matrix protein [Harbour porpoise rhabdovirus]